MHFYLILLWLNSIDYHEFSALSIVSSMTITAFLAL